MAEPRLEEVTWFHYDAPGCACIRSARPQPYSHTYTVTNASVYAHACRKPFLAYVLTITCALVDGSSSFFVVAAVEVWMRYDITSVTEVELSIHPAISSRTCTRRYAPKGASVRIHSFSECMNDRPVSRVPWPLSSARFTVCLPSSSERCSRAGDLV